MIRSCLLPALFSCLLASPSALAQSKASNPAGTVAPPSSSGSMHRPSAQLPIGSVQVREPMAIAKGQNLVRVLAEAKFAVSGVGASIFGGNAHAKPSQGQRAIFGTLTPHKRAELLAETFPANFKLVEATAPGAKVKVPSTLHVSGKNASAVLEAVMKPNTRPGVGNPFYALNLRAD